MASSKTSVDWLPFVLCLAYARVASFQGWYTNGLCRTINRFSHISLDLVPEYNLPTARTPAQVSTMSFIVRSTSLIDINRVGIFYASGKYSYAQVSG